MEVNRHNLFAELNRLKEQEERLKSYLDSNCNLKDKHYLFEQIETIKKDQDRIRFKIEIYKRWKK